MRWFDAGVNCFDKRMPMHSTIEQAVNDDVTNMCVIATHQEDWQACIDAINAYPQNLVSTMGVHPHYADNVSSDWDSQLIERLKDKRIVAVGETGLDFNRMFSSKQNQLSVFERQLEVAVERQLPVYLHERDAFEEQISLLSKYANQLQSGLVHCFTQSLEQMQAYLSLGFYIGITGWICDPKRGAALREAVVNLPIERLILETDAPYLFPKTVKPRQSNNHPKLLPNIADSVAEILGLPIELLATQSYANTCELFNLTESGSPRAS